MLNKESILKATRDLYDTIPSIIEKLSNLTFTSIIFMFDVNGMGGTELTLTMDEFATKRDEVFAVADEFDKLRSVHIEMPFSIGGSNDTLVLDVESVHGDGVFLISGYTKKDSHIFLSERDIHRVSKNIRVEDDPTEGFDYDGSINFIPKVFHHKCFVPVDTVMKEVAATSEPAFEEVDWSEVSMLKPQYSERAAERTYLKEIIEQLHYVSKFGYPGTPVNEFKPTLMKRLIAHYVYLPENSKELAVLKDAEQLNAAGTDYKEPQVLREFHKAICNQVSKRCDAFKSLYNYDIEADMKEEGFYLFGDTQASTSSGLADLAEF